MAKIIGLRGLESGFGDDATASAAPPSTPPRPAMTLAGTLMIAGSIGIVGYIFYWAAFGKGPRKKSGFARNGRRHYRKRGKRARSRRS